MHIFIHILGSHLFFEHVVCLCVFVRFLVLVFSMMNLLFNMFINFAYLLYTCFLFCASIKGTCFDRCKIHLRPPHHFMQKCRFGVITELWVFAKPNATGYSANSGANQHSLVWDITSLFANSCGRSTKAKHLKHFEGVRRKTNNSTSIAVNEK